MPCASVSENPTRSRELNLKGGLRSVTRPSSSAIRRDAKRRRRTRARDVEPAVTDPARHTPAGEPGQQEPEDGEGEVDEVGADLNRGVLSGAGGSVVGLATGALEV